MTMNIRTRRNTKVHSVYDSDNDIRMDRNDGALYELSCFANCGRFIWVDMPFAYVHYGRASQLVQNSYYGSRYGVDRMYHWECVPRNLDAFMPLFFPEQEWAA